MRYIENAKRNEALLFPEYLDDRYDLQSTFLLAKLALNAEIYTDENWTDGKPLVYMQMELKLNLSDSPYKQTAGARVGKYEVDRMSIICRFNISEKNWTLARKIRIIMSIKD